MKRDKRLYESNNFNLICAYKATFAYVMKDKLKSL